VGRVRYALPLALAVASIGVGVARVWPELGRQHDRYAQLDDREVRLAGAIHEHLDPEAFERFSERVAPGDRYTLEANFVYRTFAVYWLLPAVPAESPGEADVRLRWPAS
jgi:hypothetical protein